MRRSSYEWESDMGQGATAVLAILAVLLIFGSLIAVVTYYVLDHSRFRERPFMRSIRGSLEAADTTLSNRLRLVGRTVLVFGIAGLSLVIVLAVVKWAFEEVAR